MKRRPTKAKPVKMPVGRPTFQPCWTEAEAVELANDQLALDTAANAGYRLAMVTLARSAEDLMRAALLEASGEGGKTPPSASPVFSRKRRTPLRAASKS
jgi:hypothetical protein